MNTRHPEFDPRLPVASQQRAVVLRVLQLLADLDALPCGISLIAGETPWSSKTVTSRLMELRDRGLVRRDGARWMLPDTDPI